MGTGGRAGNYQVPNRPLPQSCLRKEFSNVEQHTDGNIYTLQTEKHSSG